MDYAMSSGGLMVHSREDWPCACCRPHEVADGRAYCLCLKCARSVIQAVEAGVEGVRALLDDITDALTVFENDTALPTLAVN
ncbi:MAG: hypothetical protein ACRD22_10935 [Terriglobia bacterium]